MVKVHNFIQTTVLQSFKSTKLDSGELSVYIFLGEVGIPVVCRQCEHWRGERKVW